MTTHTSRRIRRAHFSFVAAALLAVGVLFCAPQTLFAESSTQVIGQATIVGDDPVDLAVSAGGSVYVLDRTDAIVRTYALDLTSTGTVAVPDPAVEWTGIAHASSPDRLYWIDSAGSQLVETATDGTGAVSTPLFLVPAGTIASFAGLTYDADTDTLWAFEISNDTLHELSITGTPTGVTLHQPDDLFPELDAPSGGVAALPGGECFTFGVGTFLEGVPTRRVRVDAAGIARSIEASPLSGGGTMRALGFHPMGTTASAALYVVTASPSVLFEVGTARSCAPCPTATVSGLTASALANGIELTWTAPPNPPPLDAVRILRDGEGIATLAASATSFLDTTATGFHSYEVATTVGGVGCRGPEVAANLLASDAIITPGAITDPSDVAVAAPANTIFFLDGAVGGARTTDLSLAATGQIAAPAQGSVFTGLAYREAGDPADVTDDLLYWRNETFDLLQVTDLSGVFIAEFPMISPTGGELRGLDLADVSCGINGLVARDVLTQSLVFFDFTGVATATPVTVSLDPTAFGSGVALTTTGGYDVPVGTTPPGYVHELFTFDCLGDPSVANPIGPGTRCPIPDLIGLDFFVSALGVERMAGVGQSGDIIICGIEPRPCDDPDGLPCDLDGPLACVTLNWAPMVGVTTIDIHRNGGFLASVSGTTTTYTDCPGIKANYSYHLVASCDNGAILTSQPICKVCTGQPRGKHRIANMDKGGLNSSALPLLTSLENLGEEGIFCADLENDDFSEAPAVWVLLGTFPDNHVLTEAEGAALAEIHRSGTPIYVEGGDAWGFDPATEFACYDGVDGSATIDFGGPLMAVDGQNDLAGQSGVYSADQPSNDLIDVLTVSTTDLGGPDAREIWTTMTGGVTSIVGVAYTTTFSNVIAQSFELGGYTGNLDGVIAEYLAVLLVHGDVFFIRGDCNGDGSIDIGDPIALLTELFSGAPPASCADACDANDDGLKDIADPVAILSYLFSGGGIPLPSNCGADPTADSLDCMNAPSCP